jgi:glycine cleavage system aminomethyltransferase T
MFLPTCYDDLEAEYWKLLRDVTVWDVSVERQVEITGPDAFAFTNMLTPRDLGKCAVGQGKYVIITAEDGGIINDPVLLRLAQNHFWLAVADSDVLLWAKGVALNSGLDVEIHEDRTRRNPGGGYPNGLDRRDRLRDLSPRWQSRHGAMGSGDGGRAPV